MRKGLMTISQNHHQRSTNKTARFLSEKQKALLTNGTHRGILIL